MRAISLHFENQTLLAAYSCKLHTVYIYGMKPAKLRHEMKLNSSNQYYASTTVIAQVYIKRLPVLSNSVISLYSGRLLGGVVYLIRRAFFIVLLTT
jgi:hypothetical protein